MELFDFGIVINFLLIVILLGGFGLFFGSLAKYEQKNKIKISSMEDTKAIAKFNDIQKNKKATNNRKKCIYFIYRRHHIVL